MVEQMPMEWYETYRDMVKRISVKHAYRFKSFVEADDVSQTLWLWFLTHVSKVKEWLEINDQRQVDKLIAKSLHNEALDFCLKEKMAQLGGDMSDIFWYTPDFIKLMLPGAIAGDWKRVHDLNQGFFTTGKDPSAQGDWMAYSADIQLAFDSLTDAEKMLVVEFYVKDRSAQDANLVMSEDRSHRATAMAANRAVKKMVKFLGGNSPRKDS